MSSRPELKIDWATHEAAKFACERWHYSKCLPAAKLTKVGAWENGRFIGVVIFSRGAVPVLLKRYGLVQTGGCELTRVALAEHRTPVTRIVSVAIRFLKKFSPGLRLVVSFADPREGHHGGIYQGGNWIYSGLSEQGGSYEYWYQGKWTHQRSIGAKFGRAGKALADEVGLKTRRPTRKHRYLMPLDDKMRRQIELLRKPYPKRAGSKDNVASGFQSEEGGAIPTPALQNSGVS